jgi:hypothetical protein
VAIADNLTRHFGRGRPDTIRSIVANLVGEGSDFMDENEQIAPIQTSAEDYSDRNWEPEPTDAGPGNNLSSPSFRRLINWQISAQTNPVMLSAHSSAFMIRKIYL